MCFRRIDVAHSTSFVVIREQSLQFEAVTLNSNVDCTLLPTTVIDLGSTPCIQQAMSEDD